MKRLIRITAVLLIFCTLFLFSCEEQKKDKSHLDDDDAVAVNLNLDNESSADTAEDIQPENKKRVAITYDDGPHNIYTKRIVDELSKYGFHATFFVIGNRVDGGEYNGSSALRYAEENGHEIAIHGYTHTKYYNKCSDEEYDSEIKNTEKAIKNVIKDAELYLMRPIGGAITSERVQSSEYSVILWDVDSEDWKNKYSSSDSDEVAAQKVQTIVDNVMNNVSDGSIILLHDIYESTYDATVLLLERLHAEGYEVVTVSELLGSNLCAGKTFSNAARS